MNIEQLVRMANEIGDYFDGEFGTTDSPSNIALHISGNWDPRMRSQIIDHARAGGEGLLPISRAAVLMLAPPAPRN